MQLITTYAQCNALKQGDNLRRLFGDDSTDYQVHSNNKLGMNVDLLHLPLLTPDSVIVEGKNSKTVVSDGSISGNFPIHRTYNELINGTWYIL